MPVIDLGPVIGPQGPQGATGATGAQGIQGSPGPNQVNSATSTPLNGVLAGNGTSVTVKPVDSVPSANSTNLVSSGAVHSSRVPIYGMGKNLLHNWYFVGGGSGYGAFPVNQRGQLSYTQGAGTKKIIDDWLLIRGTAALTSNGINLSWGGSSVGGTGGTLRYAFSGNPFLGKTVTFSVLHSGGLLSVSTTMASDTSVYSSVVNDVCLHILVSSGNMLCDIERRSETAITFYAAKLELGTQQTLAHNEGTSANPAWVLNEVPDFATELLKCQQHLYAIPRYHSLRATAVRTDGVYFSFPLSTPLIGTASVEDSSGLTVQNVTGATQTGFTFSIGQSTGTYFQIAATKTSHGLTDAVLSTGSSGPLLISAE